MMKQGKVYVPTAGFTTSLKCDWSATHGTQSNWLSAVLQFPSDENTFTEFARIIREDK